MFHLLLVWVCGFYFYLETFFDDFEITWEKLFLFGKHVIQTALVISSKLNIIVQHSNKNKKNAIPFSKGMCGTTLPIIITILVIYI